MISSLVSPFVPRNSMLIVVRMETGENREFPEPDSFSPPFIIDMVKFQIDCEALNGSWAGGSSKSPKAPLTDNPESR